QPADDLWQDLIRRRFLNERNESLLRPKRESIRGIVVGQRRRQSKILSHAVTDAADEHAASDFSQKLAAMGLMETHGVGSSDRGERAAKWSSQLSSAIAASTTLMKGARRCQ